MEHTQIMERGSLWMESSTTLFRLQPSLDLLGLHGTLMYYYWTTVLPYVFYYHAQSFLL